MSLTIGLINGLRFIEHVTERIMLGVSMQDKIRNEEIRRRSRVANVAFRISKLKWKRTPTSLVELTTTRRRNLEWRLTGRAVWDALLKIASRL
ncbi:hypothetical protein EVAR_79207_1 [Eumeta japonica]|uniref:Uncharacterized protein n=1 Tax=Eumeta variegata TaxID=151549 RepID=A0A4C1UT97_EUMVA|nr:hypothetical protein EVAR_79207_1 [Eumeta japonica]